MAESANLRQNLQNVPSIFEISAAETLDNLIYPALNKIFSFSGLSVNLQVGKGELNDLAPLITWILQYLYLRNRGASFGESFYGLQRTVTETGELLPKSKQFMSATILTFLPYFERKLKQRSAEHEDTLPGERHMLNALHAFNAFKACNTFMYLIKYTISHSPIFRFLGLTLRYPAEPPKEDKITYIFLKLLEVLAFFLQFIHWWYSNEERRKVGGALRNPLALQATKLKSKKETLPSGKCPICLMQIETPTVCAISGYVYCWKCIISHLKKSATCAMSGYAATFDDLVRIYEN